VQYQNNPSYHVFNLRGVESGVRERDEVLVQEYFWYYKNFISWSDIYLNLNFRVIFFFKNLKLLSGI
jgi:hypothetical protein